MPIRDKVYDKLKSIGLTDSKEDFFKYYDNDENVRKQAYNKLRDAGLTDSEEYFYEYMKPQQTMAQKSEDDAAFEANAERFRNGQPIERVTTQSVIDANPELGSQQPVITPYSIERASLKEQVASNSRKFPKMGDLPWAKPQGGTDGYVHTTDLSERLNRTYQDGGMESFLHSEEDEKIKAQYTPKEEKTTADVWGNAMNKFALTERGGQLQSELAQIQDEITNKYLEEFKDSDEYKQFLDKKYATKDEEYKANKAVNDLFNAKYAEAISNDMQPYMQAYNNEVMHRYGVDVESGLNNIAKKEAAETLGNLSTSVNADLEKIEDEITSRQKAVRNIDWKPGMPSSRDDAKLSELRGQRTYLEGAKELIEDSQNILNAVEAEKDGNFFGGLGRGVRDKAFDIDTWTMGLSDLVGGLRLKSVLEKAEKGETLTSAEEKLLDASVNNMAVNFYYRNDLGLGYQAGEITGQSIPFMLEFLVNPVSASGNAMAKRLLTYGLKRFGSAVNSKAIKVGTRLATDALAAGGVTATTGMGHVLSGGVERLNRNYEYGLDEEGNLNVVNTHNMGVGEAFAKSATSAFLERQSEMIFNAFRGAPSLFKGIETSLPGGVNTFMNYVSNSRLGELWRGIKNNATMKELAKRTQFHGLGEEYLEEVYNNFANIPLGEMTFEEATDLENNIVTFLGLAPTQVMFSAIGGIGYGVERYKARRDLERTFGKMTEEQKRKLMELQEMGKLSTNKDIAFFLAETIKDESLTPEQKRAEIEYAYNLAKQNAIDEVSNTDVEDSIESENQQIDAATDPQTGMYGEVMLTSQDLDGNNVVTPANVFGEKEVNGELYLLVLPEGEAEKKWVRPNQYDVNSYQKRSAEEVKAINEEMIREEAAQRANNESRWHPDVPEPAQGTRFMLETDNGIEDMTVVGIDAEQGNVFVVDSEEYRSAQGNPKKLEQITMQAYQLGGIPMEQYKDAMTAQIESDEKAAKYGNKPITNEDSVVRNGKTYTVTGVDADGVQYMDESGKPNKVAANVWKSWAYDQEQSMKPNTTSGESVGEQVNAGVNVPVNNENVQPVAEGVATEQQPAQPNQPTLEEVVASLPKTNKGEIDYKAMTPQQQYQYTSITESPEVALEDLQADITAGQEEIAKKQEQLAKARGGERAALRDEVRKLTQAQAELQSFYESVVPKQAVAAEDTAQPVERIENESVSRNEKREPKQRGSVGTPVALAYLLEGGRGSIENLGYFLHGVAGAFPELENELETIRGNIGDKLGVSPDRFAEVAPNEMAEMRTVIESKYGAEGAKIFDELVSNAIGYYPREGAKMAQRIDDLKPIEQNEGDNSQKHSVEIPVSKEEQRRRPLRKRAEEWSKALGVKVHFIEKLDDVDNQTAYIALSKGSKVAGWYEGTTGKVFFYMPNLDDISEVDKTYIHEVVAHKGLREMLGRERFNELCDKVWDMMPDTEKAKFIGYPGVNGNTRAAADEYIAYLSEKENLTPEEKTMWDRVVKALRDIFEAALNSIIGKTKLTDEDISNLIKASYANLKSGIQISDFGDRVEVEGVRFNIKTNKEVVENREKQLKRSVRNGILSKKEADEIREASEAMLEIAEVIAQAEKEDGTAMFPSFSQWNGMEVRLNANEMPAVSVLKSNGDYAMNIDFAKDCIKRDATNRVLNRLAQVAPEVLTSMSAEQLTEINNIIKRHGLSVPCVGCFVEARRYRSADFARSVVNVWNALVDAVGKGGKAIDAAKKEFGNKVSVDNIITHLQDNPSDMVLLSESDIVSPDKYAALMIEHPQVPQLLQGTQGQNNPHLVVPEAIYYGDVLKLEGEKAWDVDAAYAVGGVRIQSFSDFKAKLFFDYCQVLADLASKKLPAHSYTKVPSFAELFGLTGVKINLSLYFEGTGLDSNGEYQYSPESISPEFAYEIQSRDGYTENVGTMAIGVSDAHIWKMMKDSNIRSISPYHKSGINAAVAKKIDASKFVDYTNEQNAVTGKSEKNENESFADYYTRITERKDGSVPKYGLKTDPKFNLYDDLLNTEDPIQTAKNYVEHCQQNGIIPKFPSFVYNTDGSFNNEYYKLIYDFAVTDKDGVYAPQGAVKWNEDAMPANTAEILTSALEVEEATIARNEEEVDSVVSDILNEVVGEGTRFSVKLSEEEQSIVDKAKADGTYMLAPNGKSTNLTEKQWAQVRTKAFKKWFGDWENNPTNASKVVDENGEPLVMYHGSVKQFTEFEKNKIGSMSGDKSGFYFTNKRAIAKDFYSKETGKAIENLKLMFHLTRKYKPSVYDVFLKSVNPYKYILSKDEDYGNREQIIKDAQSNGYDSVLFENVIDGPIMRQDVRIVFEPNQIKSAADNVGTFDEGNNDIRFRVTPEYKQHQMDIINETNPASDDVHTWIRSVDDIKSFEEALDDSDYADYKGDDFDPSYTWNMVEDALETGKVTVYSSYPIKNGVFVTPSYMEAQSYGGTTPYMAKVNLEDVAWIDPTQGQLATDNKVLSRKAPSGIRFRISDYGKKVKAEVDKVSSKYNSKDVMFFDNEMTDEEVSAVVPGYTAADIKPYFDEGILGGYSSGMDKISIFANNNPVSDIEDTLFHENLHSLLKGRQSIVETFAKNALERFPKNVKKLQDSNYEEKDIPEELLVRLTAKAMVYGIFDDVAYNLPDGEFENLKELLKEFGYEYEQEIKSRALAEGRRGTPTLLEGEEIHETRRNGQDASGRQGEVGKGRKRKEQIGKLFDQVADMGLQGVLGNKEYTSLMVDIYKALPEEVRAEIAEDALRLYGGSVAPAVSDYIGPKSKNSIMDKVVTIVREALRKIGFDLDLNANEVRYMAWRSKKPLDRNNMFEVAEDIDMKYRLKVGEYDGTTPDGGGTRFRTSEDVLNQIKQARKEVEKDPSEAQKEAGNYKKGHITLDGFEITLENPKGGTRSGVDKNGKKWSITMNNDYGYIRGTEAVDGDHIDVFLSDNPTEGRVFVVDQSSEDGTFDESKVMYGFNSLDEARNAYLSNYEKGWEKRIMDITEVSKDEFKKWIDFSYRKIKAFSEYKSVKSESNDIRFRVANKLQVRDEYEATIKKGGYQAREAVQDAMLSLRKFQELIEKASGKKIRDFENAWMHENRLSSVVQAEIHDMERKFYKPMMDAVKKLMSAANLEQEQVADYLMLKHGIERNREMAVRKALTDDKGKIDRTRLEQWYQEKDAIRNDATLDTWRKKQEAMDNAALNYGADMSRDYSGLTSMFGTDDLADSTQKAYDEVEALETAHPVETESLGKAIKAMTQNTLDKSFESGLMDRKVYDELSKDMYDYYIPLRGFEETTSEEVYAYLDQDRGAFNAPLKRAKGRSSKSDNPIAYLKSIAESGIMQGNRNKMKQSFLNMVINNPSDLVSVREGVWVIYNPASGEWEAASAPAIPNNATPADVEAAMEAWEQQMEQAAQNDPNIKKVAEAADVPYRVVGNRMDQHQIIVKRLGKSYTLTINGNPRLAMAINGQTNPNNTSNDGKVAAFVNNKIGALNRSLAAWYTTRNPDFVASNFMRDTFYTNTIVRAKEGNAYANKFHKNYATVLPKMLGLFRKYENGTLNPADQTEAAFLDFMMNGGETGYSNLKDVEEIKKQITKALKESKWDKAVTAVGLKALRRENIEALAEKLDILNRAVENTARFAAFLTSREEGRSIAKSVFDAKEISVNFNKKGAGGTFFGMTGQTWFGNLAAMIGASGRALYVFFNAAIQGSTNLMHVMKINPKGTSAGLAAMFLMGAVVPFLFDDDDDEKDYYDLPEHVRRNHLIIPGAGDAWISIPLPIEYRIMYGMGELLTSWRTGHERGSDIARKMLSMSGQALPLNFLEEGLEAFVPSAVSPIYQVMTNSSWTGLPIYKENDFNKNDPEYTKAYSNVDRNLLKFTKALYEWSFDEENQKERIDLNPAIIETLAKGYFGGLATQLSNIAKVGGMIAGEQEFDWRNIPIGNRILKTGDERTKEKRVTNEYFENMEKLDFLQSRERMLKKTEKGVAVPEADKFNAQKDLETMQGTEVYKKYQEFKKQKKVVDKIRKTIKEKGSTPEREKQLMEAQEAANKSVR